MEIHTQFQEMYPEAEIQHNVSLPGRYSKVNRQIDILIQDYAAGERVTIIVDGKYYSEKIDVKDVESFLAMMQDVNADKGLLVTQKGYSQAAINRAYNDPGRLELDILNFDELKCFQGFGAIPYSGKHGVLMPSPFGWIIDATRREGIIATIFQRGLNLEEAQEKKEWMYVQIFSKNQRINSLDALLKFQEEDTLAFSPNAKISFQKTIKRSDANTLIREIIIEEYLVPEYTGFVEFEDFVFFCVLLTPNELKEKNLKKLEYILAKVLPIYINTEGRDEVDLLALDKLFEESLVVTEKAEILINQGQILRRAQKFDEADEKFKDSMSLLHANYGATRGRLELAMATGKSANELRTRIDEFFDLAPANPTICQDFLSLFDNQKEFLVETLERKILFYSENKEAQGNINYHLALFHDAIGDVGEAKFRFEAANQCFLESVDKSHDVFTKIKANLDRINDMN